MRASFSAGLLLVGISLPSLATATDRHFTYTYESGVLNKGDVELEPWTTVRHGRRSEFYNRFDQRLELEIGVTDRLQTAWYINTTALTRDSGTSRATSFEMKSISSEWKYSLSNSVADAIGSALYLEVALGPAESELEAKIIFDKRFGSVLAAINIVGEYEWDYGSRTLEREGVLELDLGIAYFLTSSLSLGLEARSHNKLVPGKGLEASALFAGPNLSYAQPGWWTSLTFLPQIAKLSGSSPGLLDLDEHERYEARVIFGFHL